MIYLNLGRREQGKTTLGLYLIRQARLRVVFDPRGLVETTSRATTAEAVQIAFDQAREQPDREWDIVITPDGLVQPLFDYTAGECKAYARDHPGRSLGILVDELRFIDTSKSESFDWLLRCSTRATSIVVMTAHRPVDVPPDIRAIADVWCVFQTTQEHDLKAIAERCNPDVADRAPKLAPRTFMSWDDTNGTMKYHADPAVWYRSLRKFGAASAALAHGETLAGGETPKKIDTGSLF